MSSSVFIEPSVQLPEGVDAADGNLVVVYGKTGVNIDPNDLERLIEEKTVQSISVIRLTSPTPSMEDAEEAERLEEEKKLQDSMLDTDELTDAEANENKRTDANVESNEKDETETEGVSDISDEELSRDEESSEHEASLLKKSNRNRQRKKLRSKSQTDTPTPDAKPRAELVGLTFEGFYEAQAALEIAKEACKMAGIPFVRNTAEHEALLLVIRNDHCYTPFTSPEQMKAKLAADKLEAEEIAANTRKVQPQLSVQAKQVMLMKARKPQVGMHSSVMKTNLKKPTDDVKEQRVSLEKMPENPADIRLPNAADDFDEDEETYELIDVDSDYSASDQSGESENDRDSDLDFDVTKRQLKKRKGSHGQKKVRKLHVLKQTQEKRPEEHILPLNASTLAATTLTQRPTSVVKSRIGMGNITIAQRQVRAPQKMATDVNQRNTTSNVPNAQGGLTKIVVNKLFARPAITVTPKIQRPAQITTVPHSSPAHPDSSKRFVNIVRSDAAPQSLKPNVKEIVLNKVISSPKGAFTELSTLISAEETSQKQHDKLTTKPAASIIQNITSNAVIGGGATTTSRGFMRIDVASKNQLPAQISLETHHSANELAAEHDKQLDLIDSIVTDELNKSEEEMVEKPSIGINENIPKLVEMLESTEKALVSNTTNASNTQTTKSLNTSSTLHTATVDDIDMSHDLPEDLLQHVVELIEDDKTLKEAVEKQILEEQSLRSEAVAAAAANQTLLHQHQNPISTGFDTIPPMQITQPMPLISTTQPLTSKSIIQMSISNISSPTSTQSSSPIYTPKSSPAVRRDPIQIVRGNGRVITLPPIEAPTTRAKRRAQTTPSSIGQQLQSQNSSEQTNNMFLNESSLDSSVHSNASFSAVSMTNTMLSVNSSLVNESFSAPNEKRQPELSAKRRTSKEDKTLKKASTSKAKKGGSSAVMEQEEAEASESQGDDDDPDKLWCICRQPHNNRFMICCDACSDWFHGKCVNITKAMGREMEEKGKEWTCPLCKKKQEDKQQRKLTDMLQVKRSNSQSSLGDKTKPQNITKSLSSDLTPASKTEADAVTKTFIVNRETGLNKKTETGQFIVLQTPTSTKKNIISLNESQRKQQANKTIGQSRVKLLTTTPARTTNIQVKTNQSGRSDTTFTHKISQSPTPVVNIATVPCVVCKKPARPSTVYCSDECIRRCAQNAINVITARTSEQITTASSSANVMDEKKKKMKGLFEDLLSMPDRKPKIERITVYERKSGTRLSGSSAPTTMTIKKWLHDNPTYEIVLPGTQMGLEIENKQHQLQQHQKVAEGLTRNTVSGVDKSNIKLAKASPIVAAGQTNAVHKSIASPIIKTPKQIMEEHKQLSQRSSTPKQLQRYPQQVHIKSAKEDSKQKDRQPIKRQSLETSTGSNSGSSAKKKSADLATTSSSLPPSNDSEPIRINVRRTLKNEILQRMRESAGSGSQRLTTDEVESFVKQTESEMYNYFNRDTGPKYRNKYRSLMFNIKDRKNHTLFAKICSKQIEPKQLVRMSGAELASQELAKWREDENKHQLEMIKKSELEMLSCTKNYLFKNHKGEEILESKYTDVCVNLDIRTPVEDLVAALNSSVDSVTSFENENSEAAFGVAIEHGKQLASPVASGGSEMSPQGELEHHQHSHHHHHHHHQEQLDEKQKARRDSEKEHRSKSREQERYKDDTERDRERRERRHRSRSRERQRERHHRDKSRSRRRSHSRSKSRSRSQERRHKSFSSHQRDERREREKDRDRDNKDRKKAGIDQKAPASSTALATSKTSHVVAQAQQRDKHRHSPNVLKKKQSTLECFSLIDQIIESSKTVEEAANLVKDTSKEKVQDKVKGDQKSVPTSSSISSHEAVAAPIVAPKRVTSTSDSDQEPTSTVSIPTPPHEEPSFSRTNSPSTDLESATLWTGSISMNEVATMQINIQPLIGNSSNVGKLLPKALDVVGRIDNETVWEYLWKIRKSPNKEIVLIRLTPHSDDDINGYAKLFSYLDQKKRLGVVKSSTPQIKDIYIFPLATKKPLPNVLQVTSEHNFYNDPYRVDVIVGILVCVIGKRIAAGSGMSQVSSSAHFSSSASMKHAHRHRTDAADSFSLPRSPKRKKRLHKSDIDLDAIIKAPIVRKPAATTTSTALADDADEPYSPGDSSDEDLSLTYSSKAPPTVLMGLASADEDLKRKMEEINRQIAAQEIEIAGLLNAESTGASASVLANISIPSNLPQILASINKSKEASSGSRSETNQMSKMTQQGSATTVFEEYNPVDAIITSKTSVYTANTTQSGAATTSTSRLAQLSEAELLSMVPDDVLVEPVIKKPSLSTYYKEPPPPGV